MVAGVAKARQLAAGEPLARWGNRELWPGPRSVDGVKVTNWIRQNAMTTYHFAGTCRMGEDAGAVVDTRLRVRGVLGLRVADASVIPWTPVAAMNAPSMMVGWRAAAMLKEERLAHGTQRGDRVA